MSDLKTSDSKAVRDMYDAQAASYSASMDDGIEHPFYADALERLQARVANISGVVIDAPCGSGHMLSMYHEKYDRARPLIGVDLSSQMVAIASERLGDAADISVGDIRQLNSIESDSAAAVISHFAFHHLDAGGVMEALKEWHRVLTVGGQLVIGAWAGTGAIDYGGQADLVAIKHDVGALEAMLKDAGFEISKSDVEFDEEFMMDAAYIEGTKE